MGTLWQNPVLAITVSERLPMAPGEPRIAARTIWSGIFAHRNHERKAPGCTLWRRVLPIQKVKVLMCHKNIRETADLYTDLGLEDVAEELWKLSPVSGSTAGCDDRAQGRMANPRNKCFSYGKTVLTCLLTLRPDSPRKVHP